MPDTPPQKQNLTAATIRAKRLLGLRLLVVDDNRMNQFVAQGLLECEGATVELVDDGQRAVAAVAQTQPPFDAVLMDLQMPVMDGYEAARTIRWVLGFTHLPIIAVSANVHESDRLRCFAAGMCEHVGKPVDLDHLVETVLRCIHEKKSSSIE